ncbi:ppGpp synthetase/RelA/SpoT-type nucleotidyltransferase [Homoserinimonas aerilata]|uniref:PpGpp synthetase/RelA/SpoT-type nucleotidyltransferase n=1 Tax=Homoserinimonas aerilata TaxID=1162970 RepID=A0A542YAA4_9MICO|nr:RelA/SpoT domain-containing protein [Homoserinimonas aerilata]TQL45046.1 ppGpp synthetase/RelA/SpoT-type nucleotidyltransferase [Homoserinimonas aerilata]
MSIESLTERYFEERDALDNALDEWSRQLLAFAHTVDPAATVSGRVKSYRSMLGKAYRVASKVRSWSEFGDLVALKAVFPTSRGVTEFSEWLLDQAAWNPVLDDKQGEPTELKYKSNQFDLESSEIRDSRGEPLKIEVQVRTAVSDAWYVVDHRLQYKGIVELPSDLQRKLNRLIVLAELFDEEVEAVIARQIGLPEYAVARLYDGLVRISETLVDGQTRASRPEGLLELILSSYAEEEMESLETTVNAFVAEHGEALRAVIQRHIYGAHSFVESRDWIYYEPEAILIAERARVKPSLIRAKVAGSDFESVIGPMIVELKSI